MVMNELETYIAPFVHDDRGLEKEGVCDSDPAEGQVPLEYLLIVSCEGPLFVLLVNHLSHAYNL